MVRTDDTGHAWTIHVSDGSLQTDLGAVEEPDATLRGTALQLYAGLWNRSDEITATGRPNVVADWRTHVRVQLR